MLNISVLAILANFVFFFSVNEDVSEKAWLLFVNNHWKFKIDTTFY